MKNLEIAVIKEGLLANGFYGPTPLFDDYEIAALQKAVIETYKGSIKFQNSPTLAGILESAIPVGNPEHIDKNLFKHYLCEFSKEPFVEKIFKIFLGDKIRVSKFIDFRINLAGNKTSYSTGWHQDVETYYSEVGDEFGFESLTMWIALSHATINNSLEFVPGSHKFRKIYPTVYSDREKSLEKVTGGEFLNNFNTVSFECSPGDVMFIDPYILHRSKTDETEASRFSIDIRYVSLGNQGYRNRVPSLVKLAKAQKNIRGFAIQVLALLRIKNVAKSIRKYLFRK